MEATRLQISRITIMAGSLLAIFQNAILLLWSSILFIGVKSHPDLLLKIGVWSSYLAFILDLLAFSLLGIGFYLLSQHYKEVNQLAKSLGILFLGWSIPTLLWRYGAGFYSRRSIENIIQNITPQMVSQTLHNVFDLVYPIFGVSVIIFSLGLFKMNTLMGQLEEDVQLLDTGRRRIYSSYAIINLVSGLTITSTFLWLDLIDLISPKLLMYTFLIIGSILNGLLIVIHESQHDRNVWEFGPLIILSFTVIWVIVIDKGSFGYLTAILLIGTSLTIFKRHQDKLDLKWQIISITGTLLIIIAILFTSWVDPGSLETSDGAAWFVLFGLSFKGLLLTLWGIITFTSVYQAFRELSV